MSSIDPNAHHLNSLDDTLELLEQRSQDPDFIVAVTAIVALGRMGGPKVVGTLCRLLVGNDRDLSEAAVEALSINEAATDDLIRLLAHPETDVRVKATTCLGKLRARQAIAPLTALLSSAESCVRRECVRALGMTGSGEAAKAVQLATNDVAVEVRQAAGVALGQLGDRAALPCLAQLLTDTDKEVRRAAALSLGLLGDPAAIPILAQSLTDPDQTVQQQTVDALGNLGTDQAAKLIGEFVDQQSLSSRRAVIPALERIGSQLAAEILVQQILDDSNGDHVKLSLIKIGANALPALFTRLRHPVWYTRRYAAEIIVEIGNPPALARELKDQPVEIYRLLADVVCQQKPTAKLKELEAANPTFQSLVAQRRSRQAENDSNWGAYQSMKADDPYFDEQ